MRSMESVACYNQCNFDLCYSILSHCDLTFICVAVKEEKKAKEAEEELKKPPEKRVSFVKLFSFLISSLG